MKTTHPDVIKDGGDTLRLRVWHSANDLSRFFHVEVETVEMGELVLTTLARYDMHLDDVFGKDAIYMNAQGLEYWDTRNCEWAEWFDVDDCDIHGHLV